MDSALGTLLTFLDKVTEWVDKGDCADEIYTDFAKAFHEVLQQSVIRKLEGMLSKWIRDWLSGRKQRLQVNVITSG